MPSKDRTLATLSIYEPVIRRSTLTRMERYSVAFFDDTTTRQSAGAVSLASLRVIHISMQNYTLDHIHPRFVSSSKAAVSFSLLSVPFFRVRALFVFSSDSRAPQNCKIHYGITARSKLIVSFCANSDIGNRILPAQSKQTVNWKQLHFGNNETTLMQKGRFADERKIRSFHSNSKFYLYFYTNSFELKDFNNHNKMLIY